MSKKRKTMIELDDLNTSLVDALQGDLQVLWTQADNVQIELHRGEDQPVLRKYAKDHMKLLTSRIISYRNSLNYNVDFKEFKEKVREFEEELKIAQEVVESFAKPTETK